MATAYLGIGSNIDATAHVRKAIAWLQETFLDVAFSPIYSSIAVGFDGENFINLVARIETQATPEQLKIMLMAFEDANGRLRNVPKFSDRSLDIDLLLYDDLVLGDPQIPRNEILDFAHVLKPLAELAPELEHPVNAQNFATLWRLFSGDRNGLQLIQLS